MVQTGTMARSSDALLELTLDIEPKPCPRPRVALRGRIPVAYYPADYKKWQEQALALIREQAGNDVIVGTLMVSAIFVTEKPKTTKLPAQKWDVDNACKSILDVMTSAGVWIDDSQVVRIEAEKRWGTESRIYVLVKRWAT